MNSSSSPDYYSSPTFNPLSRDTLAAGSWTRGGAPQVFAGRTPTEQELNAPQEPTEVVEVEQVLT